MAVADEGMVDVADIGGYRQMAEWQNGRMAEWQNGRMADVADCGGWSSLHSN